MNSVRTMAFGGWLVLLAFTTTGQSQMNAGDEPAKKIDDGTVKKAEDVHAKKADDPKLPEQKEAATAINDAIKLLRGRKEKASTKADKEGIDKAIAALESVLAKQKVYTREEFRELIKDKGTDAVIAAVGRPDKSDESTYKSKDPGSGLPVNVRIMFWTFENRTRDTFTGKVDGRVVVEFRGGGPPNWFVYAVRFQQ